MNRIPLLAVALTVGLLVSPAQAAFASPTLHTASTKYSSCAKLHHKYAHGVGKPGAHDHVSSGHPVTNFTVSASGYKANKSLDRDHDGVACEAH